jgi:DUF971 family protein
MTPLKLNLKRDEKLEIIWSDGSISSFPLSYLRTMCPCAACKEVRAAKPEKKTSLTILPGNFADPLRVESAEMVGNYALRIDWSDQHSSGIYSFDYLAELAEKQR